jgi:hypothetical protein
LSPYYVELKARLLLCRQAFTLAFNLYVAKTLRTAREKTNRIEPFARRYRFGGLAAQFDLSFFWFYFFQRKLL